jgi:hypothetical protein
MLFEFVCAFGYLALLALDIIQENGRHELEPSAVRADIRRDRQCPRQIKTESRTSIRIYRRIEANERKQVWIEIHLRPAIPA